jgi:hypothetical protein
MPIYNPDNFRGDVFCNGNEINECIWVDTDRGIAEYVPKPPRVKKGTDEVFTRKLRGAMTVKGQCLLTGKQL